MITNAALIVFREGLEAILIIAAIMASMVGANRRLREPIARGALLALPASALLFVVSVLVLDELSQYGEKLEAIVGLVAIGVLLLVLNWFFHRVYWTEWIAGHRKRSKALAGAAAGGAVAGATVLGLYVLGFTSVFREGFETVLFLQALQLEAGTGIVLAGVTLGLVGVAAVGAITFKLEQRLPYKKMLVVTGVLIALVLVVMVGNTARTLQGVGWLSITPIDVELPLWMGTWLGVFPTWETIGAQLGAFAFVVGSYFLAEWVRKRQVRKAVEGLDDGRLDERAAARPTATGAPTARPRTRSTARRRRSGSDPTASPSRGAQPTTGSSVPPPSRSASSRRILVGSMKRTSSSTVFSSETLSAPRSRKNSTRSSTRSSGALAPEVMPTVSTPSSHSSWTWWWKSIRWESTPCSRATSTSRTEFDELVEPITRIRSHSPASSLTACWRLVVA